VNLTWRLASLIALATLACSSEPATGPTEIAWDRDTCAHCYMTIGDRDTAAELRIDPGGPVLAFDDLGCALLYLDARREAGDAEADFAELWVRDPGADGWLDGRGARYGKVSSTPMDYGFAATAGPAGISLAEIWTAIREVEDERRNARP
jgi:hypothetical protein